MTKITLKISTFLFLTMLAFQVQAQVWTVNGVYKINVPGQDLFWTIEPSTLNVVYAAQLPGDDELQLWTITDHRTPASSGLMEITANITGIGTLTMTTSSVEADHPNYNMTVRVGDPKTVDVGAGDYTGFDQFQRRRSSGFGGPGNDALFFRTPAGTNSRWGVAPSAAGEQVQFDGGGIDVIEFTLVSTLSNEEFDTSSIFISNPVNNEISIKGLTSNVKEVSVYSLLGQKMITEEVNAKSSLTIDASALSSGMYLVEMKGENGSFTKKIVKQ